VFITIRARDLQRAFREKGLIERLERLLLENREKWPLTDLYLTHPILESKECTNRFRQTVLRFIESKQPGEICGLVNSATSTLLTYALAGGSVDSRLVRDTTNWILAQRLEDGGWHWKPAEELPKGARSEAWSTAAVFATLKAVEGANSRYLDSIIAFLSNEWVVNRWGGFPEVVLIYLGAGGINRRHSMVGEAASLLRECQLPSGAWKGYGAKTAEGGLFRTCVVLNGLASVGFQLNDRVVMRGLGFAGSNIDKIAQAKWGGVLIQGLCNLSSALLRLKLIE